MEDGQYIKIIKTAKALAEKSVCIVEMPYWIDVFIENLN